MGTTRGKRDPVKSTLKGWMDPSASPPLAHSSAGDPRAPSRGRVQGPTQAIQTNATFERQVVCVGAAHAPTGSWPSNPCHRPPTPCAWRAPTRWPATAWRPRSRPGLVSRPLRCLSPPSPPSPVWRGEGALLRVGPVRCHLTERRAGRHRSGLVPPLSSHHPIPGRSEPPPPFPPLEDPARGPIGAAGRMLGDAAALALAGGPPGRGV